MNDNALNPNHRVQEIPPRAWVELEHFPGKVYHENHGPIAVVVDTLGRAIFSAPVVYQAPAKAWEA